MCRLGPKLADYTLNPPADMFYVAGIVFSNHVNTFSSLSMLASYNPATCCCLTSGPVNIFMVTSGSLQTFEVIIVGGRGRKQKDIHNSGMHRSKNNEGEWERMARETGENDENSISFSSEA